MDSKIKKWIMVMLAVLVISAAAAGFMPEWKKTSAIGKGKDYVAEIRIDGTIYGGPRNGTLLGAAEGVSSEQVMYEMEQARKDNRVKGVLLRINSPGGSTGATQEIAEEMDKIKNAGKPIVVSMGDMCASAGYWLASKGDYVFANPATLTGSIGVYMDYTNVEELMGKLGVKNEKIKSGAHKDILSMYRPMTGDEQKMLQTMVDYIYSQFVKTVADGRRMEESRVRSVADGRILTGQQAMELGLVDAMGNYYDALNYAGGVAGIEGDNVPVKRYSVGTSWKNILAGEMDSAVRSLAKNISDNIWGTFSQTPAPSVR